MRKATLTRKDIKAFLNQYRDANRGIQRMESRRRVVGLTETRPEPGTLAAELAARIAAKRKELAGTALRVLDVIDLLPDNSIGRDIIEMRHLNDMDWKEIIGTFGLSRSACLRYYAAALDDLLGNERVRELLDAAPDSAAKEPR